MIFCSLISSNFYPITGIFQSNVRFAELHDERMDRLSSAMSSAMTDEQRDAAQSANASRV